MNLKKIFCAVICAYFIATGTVSAQDDECTIPSYAVYPFAAQEFKLGKEEIRSLIQSAVNKMYFKGFRYLGDPRDFDHGHMLYFSDQPQDPNAWPPVVAILYHTQEDAFYHHRDDPGGRFDYLDRWARNWFQRVDNKEVDNAFNYVLKNLNYDYELNHFTIHDDMLDQSLTGVALTRLLSTQFFFSDVSDKNIPYGCRGGKSNLISIMLPSGEEKTLALLGNKYYWPYYKKYWEGRK